MTHKTYKKIFKDTALLQEMLYLYEIHKWFIEDLARKYNCDHASIIYQLKKHDLYSATFQKKPGGRPKKEIKQKAIKKYWKEKKVKMPYPQFNNEPICEGKSYKEYLKEKK